VSETVNLVVDKVGSYMVANLIVSLIAGGSALLVFLALGVPFALPLAVLVAIADLIPFVGATIAAAVSVVVALATVDIYRAVLLGVFFLVYQQVENYLIAPRVMRNTVDTSALAVLFAALVGGSLLGVVGALMAIPVAAALKVLLSDRMRARDEADEEAEAAPPPDLIIVAAPRSGE
jgi:predicted PurR-regulated permease PerM